MQNALQTIPADRNLVVYTVSDDTTVGVRRAIAGAGRTATTLVSGYGGSAVALDALRADDGWVTEQMGFFAYWGEFILAMAAAVASGVTPPPLTAPPMVVLRKDNLDTYFTPGTADLIKMPALPEESRYLLDTGVLQKFGNIEVG
jgi:ribose transport system substrate-binding protein